MKPVNNNMTIATYLGLYNCLTTRRKVQLLAVLSIITLTFVLEFATVLFVAPLVDIVVGGHSKGVGSSLVENLPITVNLWTLVALIVSVTITRIWAQYLISLWSHMVAHDYGSSILDDFMVSDYVTKRGLAKDEYLAILTTKLNLLAGSVLSPLLQTIASIAPVLGIFCAFALIAPMPAIIGSTAVLALYLSISVAVRKNLGTNSLAISEGATSVAKVLRGLLDRPRQLCLETYSHNDTLKDFDNADLRLKRSLARNILVTQIPRFLVEGVLLVAIITIVYFSLDLNTVLRHAGDLGVFVIGAQRGLPMLQRIYIGFAAMRGNLHSAIDVLQMLGAKTPAVVTDHEKMGLIATLTTHDLVLSLDNSDRFRTIPDLCLRSGMRYTFNAPSGFGKTVLVEHLIGLRQPYSGTVKVNDQRLRYGELFGLVGYMGNDEGVRECYLDEYLGICSSSGNLRTREIMHSLGLGEFVDSRLCGQTFLGASGSTVSFGQLQRIKVAKILIDGRPIMIFDEPTSNLDSEAARRVVNAILRYTDGHGLVIVISHDAIWRNACFKEVMLS